MTVTSEFGTELKDAKRFTDAATGMSFIVHVAKTEVTSRSKGEECVIGGPVASYFLEIPSDKIVEVARHTGQEPPKDGIIYMGRDVRDMIGFNLNSAFQFMDDLGFPELGARPFPKDEIRQYVRNSLK
jgi:hypothetical protein